VDPLATPHSRNAAVQLKNYTNFHPQEYPPDYGIKRLEWGNYKPPKSSAETPDGSVAWSYNNSHLKDRTEDIEWLEVDGMHNRLEDMRELALSHPEEVAAEDIEKEEEICLFYQDTRDFLPGGTVTCSPWQADEDLASALPNSGRRVCILGDRPSDEYVQQVTEAVGAALGTDPDLADLLLITDGHYGCGLEAGRAWFKARRYHTSKAVRDSAEGSSFHILPKTCWYELDSDGTQRLAEGLPADFVQHPVGRTCFAGESAQESQHLMCRTADVFVLIGGGEAEAALVSEVMSKGGMVVPVACTGGTAKAHFESKMCLRPMTVTPRDWAMLAEEAINPEILARIVMKTVGALLKLMRTRSSGQPTAYANLSGNE